MIEPGVHAVGNEVIVLAFHLRRRPHHNTVGGNDAAFGDESAAGDNAVRANDCAIHDGGIDADEAVVANAGHVNRAVVGD